MRLVRWFCIVLIVLAIVLPLLSLQVLQPPMPPPPDPSQDKWERQRKKARNEERQKDLKEDTEKLLQLATELKNQVDKTNENTLSVDVIRKTEEIEKLAKKVREKMKADYMMPAPGPSFNSR